MKYEIRYESATYSGMQFVVAITPEQAIAIFCERWEMYGDVAPSCWVAGCWS